MLIRFTPKIDHLKVVILNQKEGLNLAKSQINLLPGTNEVTDDEWKAMRDNIQTELDSGEIRILAQKVGDGRGKPGGRKAINLKDFPVNIAIKFVSECNNPETLIKWYKEVTKEEVRLAITNKMKKLEIELPEDEIPDTPNESPMTIEEFESDDDEVEGADFYSMTVAELKEACEEKEIDCSKFTKKADYVNALLETEEEVSDDEEEETVDEE